MTVNIRAHGLDSSFVIGLVDGLKAGSGSMGGLELAFSHLPVLGFWMPRPSHPHAGPGRLVIAGWIGSTAAGRLEASIMPTSMRPGVMLRDMSVGEGLGLVLIVLSCWWESENWSSRSGGSAVGRLEARNASAFE